jgi:hypothetical protein
LTALADGPSGGNGVYAYSGSATFPSSSYNAGNYWVTPVYEVPPDIAAPVLAASSPADGASSVAVDTSVTATFNEPVQAGTVGFTLLDGASAVTGSVTYDGASDTVTFTPAAALTAGTTYTAEVSATDLVGNATASPLTFTFTTATGAAVAGLWDDSTVPGTVDSGDGSSVNLGVKFVADEDLDVTGVRFYKAALNTGTHVGSLWDASGSLLAQVTFAGESTAGWQQGTFSAPVRISAGSTYVVSYHAPNGHYSVNGAYFDAAYSSGPLTALADGPSGGNGVYAYSGSATFPSSSYNAGNYWVTPIYEVP